MPRRGRSLRTIRTVKPKFKWSPVHAHATMALGTTNGGAENGAYQVIASNTTQSGNVVPPVLKIRHIKVKVNFPPIVAANVGSFSDLSIYVMFCPEGVTPSAEAHIAAHPEWVLGATSGALRSTEGTSMSITCPVSRNLNSGDNIAVFLIHHNLSNTQSPQIVAGIAYSYVARTN